MVFSGPTRSLLGAARFNGAVADGLTSTTATGCTGTIAYDTRGNTVTLAGQTMDFGGAARHVSTVKGTKAVHYTRDALNRIISCTVNGAVVTRYSYTATGHTADLTLNSSNAIQERTFQLPGGVLLTKQTSTQRWSYPNIHGDIIAIRDQTGAPVGGVAPTVTTPTATP